MIENINTGTPHPRNNKIFAGVILLVVGCLLLLRQINDFFFPEWLFDWPMILIVLGLYSGSKHNFKNPTWFILVLFGIIFLLNDAVPNFHFGNLVWPAIIISVGIWMILKRNQRWDKQTFNLKMKRKGWDQDAFNERMKKESEKWNWQAPPATGAANQPAKEPLVDYTYKNYSNTSNTGDDYLDAVSIFGGVKKTILSKDFKGGEIVNIFGGAELDFTQADINGRVVIDIVQIFGGTKIIVPSNWQVVSDIAAIFAAVDDKRIKTTVSPDSTKILVLTGASVFAGIDVRSF